MIKHSGIIFNRIAIILLLLFCILIFSGSINDNSRFFIGGYISFFISMFLMFHTNRCPHCKAYFRGLFWLKTKVGYCVKCGKYIEFEAKKQ